MEQIKDMIAQTYQHEHNKQMSCLAISQLLSNALYYKRFFPYYAFNVLGGLDNEGKGCVYKYDAVGSYERIGYSSQGSGATLITPFLDNQLKSPSLLLLPTKVGSILLNASYGQLNLEESPSWGSRNVDYFEKLEHIGKGTYGMTHDIKLFAIEVKHHDCMCARRHLTFLSCNPVQSSINSSSGGRTCWSIREVGEMSPFLVPEGADKIQKAIPLDLCI